MCGGMAWRQIGYGEIETKLRLVRISSINVKCGGYNIEV
jgi:hypothetical protein